MTSLSIFAGLGFIGLGLVDVWRGRMPNLVVYALIGVGLVRGMWLGDELGALMGLAVAGGPFLLAWLGGGAGGGDVKLAAAAGAWCRWPGALDALFAAALFGLVWALGFWIWGRVRQGRGWRGRVPYGLPLGAGAAWALWTMTG